ncbi:NADH:ubiquinone oxidoreductase [Yoonia sp.]|uniref:NADH:ubiquinone oxidoreductase n=1 Tax=Yoonia sp. TaxID=2212373 RepID=UPI003F6AB711
MIDFNRPASKIEGIAAVAALFGLIATGVAFVLYDFGFLAALVIGVIIGAAVAVVLFLGWRDPAPGPGQARSDSAPAPVAAPAKKAAPEKAAPEKAADAAATGKPALLSAAREGGADDLKQIKGVGPKLEKTLHEMGIYHFDQIAAWGPAEQAWIDDNLEGFKGRATRDDWVQQAKTLAAGGETEFSGKVKKGGVY